MSGPIRSLGSDVLFYGVLDILQRAVGFFLIPLYTRMLSPEEYGELDFVIICAASLAVLADLQFVAAFTRLFFEHKGRGTAPQLAGTAILARIITSIALAIAVVAWLLASPAPPRAGGWAWVVAAATVPISLTYEMLVLHARLLRRKALFALGALSNCVLSAVVGAVAVVWLGWGLQGILVGTAFGAIAGSGFLAWNLRTEIRPCVDRALLREMLSYSWPLIPGWWLAFGSSYLGRFFVYAQLGPADTAVLGVAMKLAGVVGLFVGAFQMAWQPIAMAQIETDAGKAFYVRSMRLYVAAGTVAIFWFTAAIGPVMKVIAPSSYSGAAQLFPIFAIAFLVSGFANNLQLGHQIAKRTGWISASAFVAFGINLALLTWLTPIVGLVAAGWALLASFVAKVGLVYFTAQSRYFIPYDLRAFLMFGTGAIALIAAALWLPSAYSGGAWAGIMTFVCGAVLACAIAGRDELAAMRRCLGKHS